MEIAISEITTGKWDDKYVWICDYRYLDINTKPIRHIEPQRVLVRDNHETVKRFYYSESHFVGLKRDGTPAKNRLISVFDNTGYRSRTGTPVRAFTTEKECKEAYNDFCVVVLNQTMEYKESMMKALDARIYILTKVIADHNNPI